MVIMAGMLPVVESARRRRRVRQSSSGAVDAGGLARGRDLGSLSSSSAAASSKVWRTTRMGSDAREAKERLDHKLRGQRQLLFKRHEMSTRPSPANPHDDDQTRGDDTLRRGAASSPLRPKKGGGGGGFLFCSAGASGRCGPPVAEAEAECAVCLEELRAGDVVARLPCTHHFHWSCAVESDGQTVVQVQHASTTAPARGGGRPCSLLLQWPVCLLPRAEQS